MGMLKLSYTLVPFTLTGLRNGSIQEGDILIPIEDIPSLQDKKEMLFCADKEYPILQVWPNQESAEGVILMSELDKKWYIHFNSPDGGAQYFKVEQLNTEEALGTLNTLPQYILKLLNKYKGTALTRTQIISEMQHQFYDKNPKVRAKLREDTEYALHLLEAFDMILPGTAMGSFVLSPKGQESLTKKSEELSGGVPEENLGE
jgi:hypothetical protein